MTGHRRELVVRRGDIERMPPPPGGEFATSSVLPRGVPRAAVGVLGVFCVNTSERVVSLSYDDGPNPEHTPRILDALARYGATATFFVLARQVLRHPELTRRIVAEGHEIALHGSDHRSLLTMTTRAALAYLREARRQVEAVIGRPIELFRPPYGDYSLRQAIGIRRMGLELVIWSSDPADWRGGGARAISDRAIAGVFPGAVVLLHDNQGDGVVVDDFDRAAVTEAILDDLDTRRYRATSVGRLVSEYQVVRSMVSRSTAQSRVRS